MKPKSFVFTWVGIIIFAVLVGLLTKFSYQDNNSDAHEKINEFSVAQTSIDWENSEWKNAQQLADEAEYIFIVKKAGQSTFLYHATLTPVEVVHVFKSNEEDFLGEQLYLFEPSFVLFEFERYFPHNSYNMMLDDSEYLVFLNRRTFPEGYVPNDVEKHSYLFTTNCALSKYLLNNSFQNDILYDDGTNIKYNEINLLEIIVYDKKQLDYYNRFKEEIVANYKQ